MFQFWQVVLTRLQDGNLAKPDKCKVKSLFSSISAGVTTVTASVQLNMVHIRSVRRQAQSLQRWIQAMMCYQGHSSKPNFLPKSFPSTMKLCPQTVNFPSQPSAIV